MKKIYLVPVIGVAVLILIGSALLMLPICNKVPINFKDALFVATSSVSVTGFSTVDISSQFTFWGQAIIAILVQIGALGFMLFIALILTLKNKKLHFSDIIILSNSMSSGYTKIKEKILRIVKYTLLIELTGTILMCARFIPVYGIRQGIWYSVFHSITAFCNAGFSLFGNDSLMYFRNDVTLNIILIILMTLGGIGFFVIEDVILYIKHKNDTYKMKLNSKLVLSSTLAIVVIGTVLFCIFEKNLTFIESLFSVTTLRTTGFSTVNFGELSTKTKIISLIIMFIGGAPGSTSGGIRVIVFSILFLTVRSILKGENEVNVFNRHIDNSYIKKAITIFFLNFIIVIIGSMIFITVQDLHLLDTIFITISSLSTVSISTIDMSILTTASQYLMILLMFTGKVGAITLTAIFFEGINSLKKKNNSITYANESVIM